MSTIVPTEDMSSTEVIPYPVLLPILERLDCWVTKRYSVPLVCKRWRHIGKVLGVDDICVPIAEPLQSFISWLGTPRRLTLLLAMSNSTTTSQADLLGQCLNMLPSSIEELTLQDHLPDPAAVKWSRLPKLHSVTLLGLKSSSTCIAELLRSAVSSHLTALELVHWDNRANNQLIKSLLVNATRLRRLSVPLTEDRLHVQDLPPSVTHLTLTGWGCLTGRMAPGVCAEVRSLQLMGNCRIDSAAQLDKLESLECRWFTGGELPASLTCLHLHGYNHLAVQLPHNLTKLRCLTVEKSLHLVVSSVITQLTAITLDSHARLDFPVCLLRHALADNTADEAQQKHSWQGGWALKALTLHGVNSFNQPHRPPQVRGYELQQLRISNAAADAGWNSLSYSASPSALAHALAEIASCSPHLKSVVLDEQDSSRAQEVAAALLLKKLHPSLLKLPRRLQLTSEPDSIQHMLPGLLNATQLTVKVTAVQDVLQYFTSLERLVVLDGTAKWPARCRPGWLRSIQVSPMLELHFPIGQSAVLSVRVCQNVMEATGMGYSNCCIFALAATPVRPYSPIHHQLQQLGCTAEDWAETQQDLMFWAQRTCVCARRGHLCDGFHVTPDMYTWLGIDGWQGVVNHPTKHWGPNQKHPYCAQLRWQLQAVSAESSPSR